MAELIGYSISAFLAGMLLNVIPSALQATLAAKQPVLLEFTGMFSAKTLVQAIEGLSVP